jgi:hypothetical protein
MAQNRSKPVIFCRLAVVVVLSAHVTMFLGELLLGCKHEEPLYFMLAAAHSLIVGLLVRKLWKPHSPRPTRNRWGRSNPKQAKEQVCSNGRRREHPTRCSALGSPDLQQPLPPDAGLATHVKAALTGCPPVMAPAAAPVGAVLNEGGARAFPPPSAG